MLCTLSLVRRLLCFGILMGMNAPSSSGCGRANQTLRLFIHQFCESPGPYAGLAIKFRIYGKDI